MGIEAIAALLKCMEDIEIDSLTKRSNSTNAYISNLRNNSSGPVNVTFHSNWHAGNGPYLEIDEVAKSYGVFFTDFKSWFPGFDMKYDEKLKELTVSGKDYEFTLCFA